MEAVKTTLKNEVITAVAGTIKGTSFISLPEYTSKGTGEVAAYTILAGFSYKNAVKKDLVALKNLDLNTLADKFPMVILNEAYKNVEHSLNVALATEKERQLLRLQGDKTVMRSDAQIDAYTQLAKGVKQCNEDGLVHIFGLQIKKTVLVAVEKKVTKSRELTLAQNAIKYTCDFRTLKYRTFIVEATQVKMQGVVIL
jgi:hypothetical protein